MNTFLCMRGWIELCVSVKLDVNCEILAKWWICYCLASTWKLVNSVSWLVIPGLPTLKFCSEPHISLQGTSWEPKSNMQNHFRTNEKKSILTRKNTFYSTLFARRLYNYSELFPSPVFQSVLDIKINATPSWKRLFTWFFKESLKWGKT